MEGEGADGEIEGEEEEEKKATSPSVIFVFGLGWGGGPLAERPTCCPPPLPSRGWKQSQINSHAPRTPLPPSPFMSRCTL